MQSRQAGTLLSAFADYSGNLAAAQSVFPASRDHDRDAVLKFHFARRSVCRLSPPDCQSAKAAFATLFPAGTSKGSHPLNASAVCFSNR